MSSFTEPLAFRSTDKWQGGRRVVSLTRGFRYYVGDKGSSLYVDVPEGFETDLGSIPRLFQGWITADSPWSSGYALHDWLYREAAVSRWMCDLILYEALGVPQRIEDWIPGVGAGEAREQVLMPWERRVTIYRAVRLGGWSIYRRYAAAKVQAHERSSISGEVAMDHGTPDG